MRPSGTRPAEPTPQCPICDLPLLSRSGLTALDSPCRDCGCVTWCHKHVEDGRAMLAAIPGRTPEDADVQRLAHALLEADDVESVIIDLSQLHTVNSLFLARLLALNKQLQPLMGALAVCGLSPIVREIFRRTHFDTLLDVHDDQSAQAVPQNAGSDPAMAF